MGDKTTTVAYPSVYSPIHKGNNVKYKLAKGTNGDATNLTIFNSFVYNNKFYVPTISSALVHYKMNDNIGTADVIDSSGNSLTGYLMQNDEGAATSECYYANGKINSCFQMYDYNNNLAKWIKIREGDPLLYGQSEFTIASWVKLSTEGMSSTRYIYSEGVSQDNSYINSYIGSDNKLVFGMINNDTSNWDYCIYSTALVANQWYHIGVNYNNGNMTLFVSGIYVSRNITVPYQANMNYAVIGASDDLNYSNTFQGWMDDFRIYTKTLTQDEIFFLYNHGKGTEETSGVFLA